MTWGWSLTEFTGRLRLAASAVAGMLTFLVLISSASQALGGGLQGLVLTVALALLIAIVVLVFPREWLGQTVKDSPPPKPLHEVPRPSPLVKEARKAARAPPKSVHSLEEERVCAPGPHRVEAGEVKDIELDVRKGDRIQGTIVEVNGRKFNWCIVDQEGLVELLRDEVPESAAEGRRVNADHVRWTARRPGPWFLAIDVYGRSAKCDVAVDLRRTAME